MIDIHVIVSLNNTIILIDFDWMSTNFRILREERDIHESNLIHFYNFGWVMYRLNLKIINLINKIIRIRF